jgi:restriction endonuclease S subunit
MAQKPILSQFSSLLFRACDDLRGNWTQSETELFVLNSKQSTTLACINLRQLDKLPVALPPVEEQEWIEMRIASLQARLEADTTHVANLREHKQGLMRDLPTGGFP